MITYFQSIELEIIGAIFAREDLRATLLTLDSKFFLVHQDFFEKTKKFFGGVQPGFTPRQWEYVKSMDSDFWCPPIAEKLIEELKRSYITTEIQTSRLKNEDDVNRLIKKVFEVKNADTKTIQECLNEIINENFEGKTKGIPTGIKNLDNILPGIKPAHFWIIGGYTSVGKTNFSLEIVRSVARDHSVIFFSLEMTQKDLVNRIFRAEANDYIADAEVIACENVEKMNLKIIDNLHDIEQIETYLAVLPEKPKLIVVDFIQNVGSSEKNEYEKLTSVARRLQLLALREKICVIALSQVSNESVNSKTKTIGFKGSGALAAACDIGIELTRDTANEKTEIVPFICNIRKNRHGRTAEIPFEFNRQLNRIIFK
jgi:replicative DNA helicase